MNPMWFYVGIMVFSMIIQIIEEIARTRTYFGFSNYLLAFGFMLLTLAIEGWQQGAPQWAVWLVTVPALVIIIFGFVFLTKSIRNTR